MTRFTLSIQNLYETLGNKLTYGSVTSEEYEDGAFYYDFYNSDGRLACCDGETVKIIRQENGVYTLQSDCATDNITFDLTADELNIATVARYESSRRFY